ncbi:MAG: M48 family metalloprotease [Calothrix sp. C42_A2020_038]|nr:M48 family metalloprotease [Calothrix sp. C42_A2020_038]
MKRRWKSLFLSLNWVFLSIGTSIFVIVTQPEVLPAQQPVSTDVEIVAVTSDSYPVRTQVNQQQDTFESKYKDKKQPETQDDNQNPQNVKKPEEGEKATPEEIARQQRLMEGDKLYLAGNIAEAEKIYREVKEPFKQAASDNKQRQPAIVDAEQLTPAGRVYWREAQAGILSNLQTRALVPLELLVQQVPQFIPGHIKYAETLRKYGDGKKALQVLERAATLYPNQPDLVRARVTALGEAKKWMEASLAARQYAILNPNDPLAPEFTKLADDNLKRYKSHIRGEIRGNAIANIITGALGYAVTGSLLGPFSALDSTILLLQGEQSIGESVAKQAKKQLDLVKDETVNAYVNEIGQKLASLAGRNEFKYEFFVIPEPDLNAFALPGGKIFINAGAIEKARSEAELAGLIGHELSHVVLSHGFQLVTQGNLISNITQYLPLGGTVGQLFGLSYSREMERQADVLGTRLLVTSGYAADGLRNLMVTLKQQQKNLPPTWASSHPGGNERVSYLEDLITRNSYNRYAYEGVAKHQEIRSKVKIILKEVKECRKDKKKCPDKKKPEHEQRSQETESQPSDSNNK